MYQGRNLNRGRQPERRGQLAIPRRAATEADLSGIRADITELDLTKANASTMGGVVTRMNGIENDVADKADADATAIALGTKADVSDMNAALAGKADGALVSALSAAMNGKASAAALTALAATVPVITTDAPLAEAVSPTAGVDGMKVPGGKHQHPRLSSTTGNTAANGNSHTIGANGLATIMFTQAFDLFPHPEFSEVPPATGTMPDMPANFRVQSWIRETMTPTPSGKYIGCVVKCWRGQALPNLGVVSGLLTVVISGVNSLVTALTGFNVFGASATGTTFTCFAVKRSDG